MRKQGVGTKRKAEALESIIKDPFLEFSHA